MKSRIRLKDVAAKAGVHFTTVSMALRDHPSLPAKTRDKLKKLAKEMGYKPDPMLAALNAYSHDLRKPTFHGIIAWLDCFKDRDGLNRRHPRMFPGMEKRCLELGYQLERFWLHEPEQTTQRLSRILYQRGVQGIIVPSFPGGHGTCDLRWNWFSAITLSNSLNNPQLHLFTVDHFMGMKLLLRKLREQGFQRPGLFMAQDENERTDRLRLGGFLLDEGHPAGGPIVPPLIVPVWEEGEKAFEAWCKQHKPDAIIGQPTQLLQEWVNRLKYSAPIIGLVIREDENFPGLIQDSYAQMKIAMDMLAGMIQRGEKGPPEHPMRIMLPPEWHSGSLAPAISKTP